MNNLIAILKTQHGLNIIGMTPLDALNISRTVTYQAGSDCLLMAVKTMDRIPYPKLTPDLNNPRGEQTLSMLAQGRYSPIVEDQKSFRPEDIGYPVLTALDFILGG
jgi:hypothetical protein